MNNFTRLAYLTVSGAIAFGIAITGITSENELAFAIGITLLVITWLLIIIWATAEDETHDIDN